MTPLLATTEGDDDPVAFLNGLGTDDKVRVAKLLTTRGYKPGPVPADSHRALAPPAAGESL